ncbi:MULTISPECIES: hypothetical protein [unclassified Xanthobacter]|uniref:hypothetical protein n=1 Tax=unclassified Xanthobacter TaxID=2623496 RepID=UPI001F30600C|nr:MULTISPECIES: hypothetical protein [unclassified Xanthobacter]
MQSALSQRPAAYSQLAAALRAFADEHGLPNAVSPSELARLTCVGGRDLTGSRLLIGRILTSERIALNRELARVGISVTAYADGPEGTGKLAHIDAVPGASPYNSI